MSWFLLRNTKSNYGAQMLYMGSAIENKIGQRAVTAFCSVGS